MIAVVVGALITGFLVVAAIAPDPRVTGVVGHVAMGGLLVYLLIREFTRPEPSDTKVEGREPRAS
jgi:hypothetical protein